MMGWTSGLYVLVLAFVQNVSFSILYRSRNRDNATYHCVAAIFANGLWFLTFRQLVLADMDFLLFMPYTLGTVAGSIVGVKISMIVEAWLGAASDSHLNGKEER